MNQPAPKNYVVETDLGTFEVKHEKHSAQLVGREFATVGIVLDDGTWIAPLRIQSVKMAE